MPAKKPAKVPTTSAACTKTYTKLVVHLNACNAAKQHAMLDTFTRLMADADAYWARPYATMTNWKEVQAECVRETNSTILKYVIDRWRRSAVCYGFTTTVSNPRTPVIQGPVPTVVLAPPSDETAPVAATSSVADFIASAVESVRRTLYSVCGGGVLCDTTSPPAPHVTIPSPPPVGGAVDDASTTQTDVTSTPAPAVVTGTTAESACVEVGEPIQGGVPMDVTPDAPLVVLTQSSLTGAPE